MKNLFRNKKEKKESIPSKNGEKLTDDERAFVKKHLKKHSSIPCINCKEYFMYVGPQGGLSTNMRCPNCGQGINFAMVGGEIIQLDNIGIDETYVFCDSDKTKLKEFEIK